MFLSIIIAKIAAFLTYIFSSKNIKRSFFKKNHSQNHHLYFGYVNPNDIKYYSLFLANSFGGQQSFFGLYYGLWYKIRVKFCFNPVYIISKYALSERKSKLKLLLLYLFYGKSLTESKFKKALHYKDRFLNEGYKSIYELDGLDSHFKLENSFYYKQEPFVGIGKNGELIRLLGGRHRLAIAQLLLLDEIPVVISLIHPDGLSKMPKKVRLLKGLKEDYKPFNESNKCNIVKSDC